MPIWARVITILAGLRAATAVVLFLSDAHRAVVPPPLPWLTYVALATCFGGIGFALMMVNKHDVRATWLGATFVLVAAPLTTPFFNGPLWELGWFWFLRPDAFLPAFLWRFAGAFPSPLVGRPERVFERMGQLAAAVGALIFVVTLSFVIWPATEVASWRVLFRPRATPSLYYPLLYGLTLAAFGALIWRASRGRADEKRRLMLFAIGLSAGAAPLVCQVLLETIPAYYAFVHRPGIEQVVGGLVFGALALIPFVTAYSVLFDRIVDVKVVLRAALQYALARYTILAVAAVPFAALALIVYRDRAEPLVAFVRGARPLVLGGIGVLGLLALRARYGLIAMLDRKYFRESYDRQQLLDLIMGDVLNATAPDDLQVRLHSAIARGMHADLTLFVGDTRRETLTRPDGTHPIAASGVLIALAAGDTAALDVDPSDRRSPFRRLPAEEQQWLLDGGFVMLIPLHGAGRKLMGLLALTSKRSGLLYSIEDRRFLGAVAASASLALDNLRLRSTGSDGSERAARECQTCSRLNGPDAKTCACGGQLAECAAPHTLRGIYRLDRRIGAGGMGVVYLARDLNLGRAVAIKTLPGVSPEQSLRLRTEARVMAAVQHPNLAVIHGVETWQGIPFLIQEFLSGGTLADRLRTGPIAIRAAVELCGTLAEALDHLHTAGIVHRDVKPSNIGFTERQVAKLFDFGLAKLPSAAEDETDTTDTHSLGQHPIQFGDTAVFGGTPAYMSPEALDAAAPARPALDLWALGVVLFESVTGRRPFGGHTRDEIRSTVRQGLQQPPSAFNSQCPADLDAFLLRALHPQPSQRCATARDLHLELGRLRVALP